ncbi:RNA polymerase factor sigma-32 [Thalassotalea ganghwensis]
MSTQLMPLQADSTLSFNAYMSYVHTIPLLSEQQERELFERFHQHNDLEAVHQLVLSHLRFVAYIARSFKGYGLPIEDLVQEGTIGLMKSVRKFSVDVGVRLTSFAIHYIKSEIQEYVIRNWRLVKATTTKAKRKLFFNLRRLKGKQEWLSYQEKQQVAATLKVNIEDVSDMESQLYQTDLSTSLPTQQDNDGDSYFDKELQNALADTNIEQVIEDDFTERMFTQAKTVIARLDERSRDIFTQRWLNEDKTTHKQLADKYGISQERVRQIEQKALSKLRAELVEQ